MVAADGITPRAVDYGQWYLDIVKRADLADHSSVRGCMVIKPHGYAIWEKLQRELDDRFKATGHVNAYFPLFIPKSYLAKEASHALARLQGEEREFDEEVETVMSRAVKKASQRIWGKRPVVETTVLRI